MSRFNWLFSLLFGCATLGTVSAALADEYRGKVVSVSDGDSLTVMHDNVREKVILFGVDCPELNQDFGAQAKQYTDQACYGKMVTINQHGADRRGRVIGVVYLPGGSNLNEELVKQGLAWWSDKYAPNDKNLKAYQETARAQKLGLWAAPNPTPPWIFRNGEKAVQGVIKTGK